MPLSLYKTADQSHTLYNSELDETYHSRNGAVEESEYVFLRQGFEKVYERLSPINILEVGFGTGLNAILSLIKCEADAVQCNYHSLETFPLTNDTIEQLNYTEFIPQQFHHHFGEMHLCKWNEPALVSDLFSLNKIAQSIHSFQPDVKFDLVYFDAFGPDKQPDMWTQEVFGNIFDWMNSKGVFVTYSAKGDVRRALKSVGFEVELLPGPPRKRHMLRAIKP